MNTRGNLTRIPLKHTVKLTRTSQKEHLIQPPTLPKLRSKLTAWSDRPHQSVHLDVPVFDVGARLAKFPLSSLLWEERNPLNHFLTKKSTKYYLTSLYKTSREQLHQISPNHILISFHAVQKYLNYHTDFIILCNYDSAVR